MTGAGWAAVLQWSRLGVSAMVFLIAARLLPLDALGQFAVVLAPVRLLQNALRIGFSEVVILGTGHRAEARRLAALSILSGSLLTLGILAVSVVTALPLLATLSVLPLIGAMGAVSEGVLRRRGRLRDLALRTCGAQAAAACGAGIALWGGAGIWSLALFALTSAAVTAALSIRAAPIAPRWSGLRRRARPLLRRSAEIAGRDMLSSGLFPMAQILVAAFFGLTAAGAFQVAIRLVQLTEALTLAPLRLTLLPVLREAPHALDDAARITARIALWAWPGLYLAAPDIALCAVGPEKAQALTPILRALCPLGLFGALSMPWLQAVAASGGMRFLLGRSALVMAANGLGIWALSATSLVPAAIAMSGLSGLIWIGAPSLRRGGPSFAQCLPDRIGLAAAAAMVLGLQPVLSLPPSELRLIPLVIMGTAIYALTLFCLSPRSETALP